MTIEQALGELREYTCDVPQDALDAVREMQKEAEPVLLAELDWCIQNPLAGERSALFDYALYLCAEMRAEAAFERYLAMLRLPRPILDMLLGDIVTEAMPEMLARTCTGRIDDLKALVEDPAVEEFARGAALLALRNMAMDGEIERLALKDYCAQLLVRKLEREPSHIWDITVSLAETLHMREALPAIEAAYRAGWADPGYQQLESVQSGLATQSADEAWSCAERKRRKFSTTEREMAFFARQWPADGLFPERDPQELLEEPRAARQVRKASKKGPGRNEPCPCGSGKKYKKCCIDIGFDPDESDSQDDPSPGNPADEWMAAGYYYFNKSRAGQALECWRQCWQQTEAILPAEATDPWDEKCNTLFSSCSFFGNWLQDYQMLLEDRSEWDIQAVRDGMQFCREALQRFPAMDELMRMNFEETQALLLIRSGKKEEGFSVLEQMVLRNPRSAQGYVLQADLLSRDAARYNLHPDWSRAEQLLRQAQTTATDCADWDVDVRLDDLMKKMRAENEGAE